MHIHFLRTGGFAGRRIEKEFDTESLPAGKARELNGLLEKSGFFELPVRLEGLVEGSDRFCYRLTVEVGGNVHTVEAVETAVPVEMRPLLDWLMRG